MNPSNGFKVYSKLENNFHLSNKCALFYNMKRYYEAINRDPFEVIPLTFHIKYNADNDPEFVKFSQVFKELEVQTGRHHKRSCTEENVNSKIGKEIA